MAIQPLKAYSPHPFLTRYSRNQKGALKNPKFEYQNSKQIQNPNASMLQTNGGLKGSVILDFVFGHLYFEHSYLFRISCFEFRIFLKPVCSNNLLIYLRTILFVRDSAKRLSHWGWVLSPPTPLGVASTPMLQKGVPQDQIFGNGNFEIESGPFDDLHGKSQLFYQGCVIRPPEPFLFRFFMGLAD